MKRTPRSALPRVSILFPAFLLLTGMVNIGTQVPSFSIEDQFQKKWSEDDYKGKVALYMVCDRDGYEYADNWTDKLVPKFKDKIHFIPVADVSPVPGLLKGYVRGKFKDEFNFSVLLDWEGTLVDAFNLKAGYPTLVLTDKNGVVKYRAWGKGSQSEVTRMENKLRALLGD